MKTKNRVFIATSLDGYIADQNGGLDWLHSIPNPDQIDMGFVDLMNSIDAIIMGRVTFETVCAFDCDWPYSKPVFVLSRSLKTIPDAYKDKVELVNGELTDILKSLNNKAYKELYIDGGSTIQSFLKEDLIDELCVSTMPILLGGGSPLFSDLPKELEFELIKSEVFLDQIVQSHYRRV